MTVQLHVDESGKGDLPLVLAHGFAGSARNFRPQARAFAERCRTVLFDARGHARSEAPDDPAAYEPERFVEDFDRMRARVGEKAVVGGLSMGAAIALSYALAHPERLLGIVLAAYPHTTAGDPEQVAWADGFADAIDAEGIDAAGAKFVWGDRSKFDEQGARLIRQGFLEHPPHSLAHILRQLIRKQPEVETLAPQLASISVPTLIVVGERDELAMESCKALGRLIPGAKLVIVPGAGHVVNLAAPKAFNAAVSELLDRIG